jgi:plastocyanin
MEDNNQNTSTSVDTSNKSSVWPIAIVVVLLIAIGGYFFMNSRGGTVTESNSTVAPKEVASQAPESPTKEFTLQGSNFKFDVKEIKVNKGDTVKVTFKSAGGTHDFVLDEFDVKTKVLSDGGEETVTFVADKTGEFEYYCSVGQHRQMGMVGKLIVE